MITVLAELGGKTPPPIAEFFWQIWGAPPSPHRENPNSLRNIYSQVIPKGRPGTFQQDVLQCLIIAFLPDICAPYAYIRTEYRCPTVLTV